LTKRPVASIATAGDSAKCRRIGSWKDRGVASALRKTDSEAEEHRAAAFRLLNQCRHTLLTKLDRAYEHFVEGRIPDQLWNRKSQEWDVELRRIEGECARVEVPRQPISVTGAKILELAKQVEDLYRSQNPAEQRRLLEIVLSNCTFDRGTLCPTYSKLAAVTALRAQTSQPPTISVERDTGCGCCLNWVAHLRRAGFKTTVTESPNRAASSRVPTALRSCHTGTVGGYLIEGHVPVADITRLLQTRPKVLGIAAPGMPAGSTGMEVPGGAVASYDVITFDAAGKTSVFASHR